MNSDPGHSNEIFREISAEEWKTAIVDTIRCLRHKQNISQNEIYSNTGVDANRMERKNMYCGMESLRKILNCMEISPAVFFKRVEGKLISKKSRC